MSFQGKLILGDLEFNILTAEFAISRAVDTHNRPNGRTRGGVIDITIESGNNHQLTTWIVENQTKDGRLEFYRRDTANSSQKTVNFTNAFCIYMKEQFISDGSVPMITKLTISSHRLVIDNNTVQNTWAGMESESGTAGAGGSPTQTTATTNSVSFE